MTYSPEELCSMGLEQFFLHVDFVDWLRLIDFVFWLLWVPSNVGSILKPLLSVVLTDCRLKCIMFVRFHERIAHLPFRALQFHYYILWCFYTTFVFLALTLSIFNVYGSVPRKYIPIYIQQDATLHSLFILETALHVSGGTSTHY
jgi:hypothetical protein